MALTGQAIVVTGATRGLGRAIASALHADGAALVIGGRDRKRLAEVAEQLDPAGERIRTVAGSVADDATLEQLVATCVAQFGRIDGIVGNAGLVRDRTLLKMTPAEFDEVIAVNLRGVWSGARHAAAAMRERGGGWILNVASSGAFHGSVGQSNYAAAKAGAVGLTRAWSEELRRYGIRVNALCPFVATDMTTVVLDRVASELGIDREQVGEAVGLGDADEVAAVVAALARDECAPVTGQIIGFDGRRLALWSHPDEAVTEQRSCWDAGSLAGALVSEPFAPLPMHRPWNGSLRDGVSPASGRRPR